MTNKNWEKEYRLKMAKILGSKGKFAMNDFVELTRDLLTRRDKEMKIEIEKKINDLMKEFANTPVSKRGTGWNWLIKVRDKLKNQ